MALSDKQKELDRIKWEKSCRLGFDACGSFDYCRCCDKGMENPCEKAHNKFYNVPVVDEHELVVEINTENMPSSLVNSETKTETKAKKQCKTSSKKTTTKAKKTTEKSTSKKSTSKKTK